MPHSPIKFSSGSLGNDTVIHSSLELGQLIREQRKQQSLTQAEIAGLGNTGNRFIVDLESGKPTIQLQKALDILALLGLELVVRQKSGRG
ncbi:MAG: helix-turn-helix transcriptional regulator [Alcaligenaceae bacterium]|nr:helix-turn-helix transcriptional regulator [Alcaligenaceae bacterium]